MRLKTLPSVKTVENIQNRTTKKMLQMREYPEGLEHNGSYFHSHTGHQETSSTEVWENSPFDIEEITKLKQAEKAR